MALYELSDDQIKNIINIISLFPSQMIPGALKEMRTYVNEADDIIRALKNPIKQKEEKKE